MKTEEIDRQIGMPDIDAEWTKFEKSVIGNNASLNSHPTILPHRSSWMSRAAAVTLVCTLGVVALASSLYIYNERSQEPEVTVGTGNKPVVKSIEETSIAEVADEQTEKGEPVEYLNAEKQEFVFDNVEMQEIARCLQKHYGVEPIFRNEEVKHIRLYVTLSQKQNIEQIIEVLNHLEVVQLSVKENKLIVE